MRNPLAVNLLLFNVGVSQLIIKKEARGNLMYLIGRVGSSKLRGSKCVAWSHIVNPLPNYTTLVKVKIAGKHLGFDVRPCGDDLPSNKADFDFSLC